MNLASMIPAASIPRRIISIRAALLAVVALLSLVAVGGLGWQAVEDVTALQRVEAAQRADAAGNRFAAGLFEVLMERSHTNNALQAARPAGPEALAEIGRRRAAVQALFVPGLEVLAATEFPGREALLRGLREELARADIARRAADAALRVPRESRDAALLRDFIPTITASVAAATNVWFAASHALAAQDAILARLAVVKELGWRLRDTAGLERSGIGSGIAAGQPVAADRLALHAAIRSRVDLMWSMVENLAPSADPATHPALRAAQVEARHGYFEGFRPLVDRMVTAGAASGHYPMDIAAFMDTTTAQLGTLLGVMHAGATASEARTAVLLRSAWFELGLAFTLVLLALAFATAAVRVVMGRVVRPLSTLTTATEALAGGNLSIDVPGGEQQDEVGALARGLTALRDGSRKAQQLEAEAAATRAARDRRQSTVDRHTTDFAASIGGIMASLGDQAGSMRQAADQMAELVGQSRGSATSTANGSLESSRNLSAVASATDELSASVSEITRQVAGAASAAREAVQRAEATDATVRGLSQAAGQIGEVVQLISRIAGQTNLLALNATIEAARAGDAGKGFAVVASEVKALAAQTARATDQIATQVAAIQGATGLAVEAVREVGESIGRMNEVAAAIAAAVEQQGAATREIASQVSTVAAQTEGAASAMQQVATAAESAGGAADSVLNAAEGVGQVSRTLRAEVDQFLAAVRTEELEPGGVEHGVRQGHSARLSHVA